MLLAIPLGAFHETAGVTSAFLGAALLVGARLVPRGRALRKARFECGAGVVRVRGAGTRDCALRAAEITGATTAHKDGTYRLTVAHVSRPGPITLEVRTLAELHTLCRTLGIGHHGYGHIEWEAFPTVGNVFESLLRLVSTAAFLAWPAALAADNEDMIVLSALTAIGAALTAGLFTVFRLGAARNVVTMHRGGFYFGAGHRFEQVDYRDIDGIMVDSRHLVLHVRKPDGSFVFRKVEAATSFLAPEGVSPAEREILVELLTAATNRAHGHAVPKDEVSETIEPLRRRRGEHADPWLARVDAMASTLGGGYRGSTFSRDDLWHALEDPEADPDLRAAAARVLARVAPDELKLRVETVLEAEHDQKTRIRIAAVVNEDVEHLRAMVDAEAMVEAKEEKRANRPIIR